MFIIKGLDALGEAITEGRRVVAGRLNEGLVGAIRGLSGGVRRA